MPAAGTEMQSAFAVHYVSNGGDATKAAIAAGYSDRTAGQIGWQLLQKPVVRELIHKELLRQRACSGVVGLNAMVRIAEDAKAPAAARVAAARALMEHAGLIGAARDPAAARAADDATGDSDNLLSAREVLAALAINASGVLQ